MKPVPKRPSRLDPHRSEIDAWLDAEPAITAVEVLARLRTRYPDRFTAKHLRSTQQMVRAWRTDQAKRVIRSGTAALEAAIATVRARACLVAHRDLPRAATPNSWRSRAGARVPPVDYKAGSPTVALGNTRG